MKHGSLFSGIGGFDLAAEWMGWENVFHCEWNPFGQKVLKHYWPNAISYNDITKTDFTIHRGTIDILTGGFPCQPYSQAGKRLGKEDERHLWPEMLRAIREIQPVYVVGENVRGLTNWNGGMVFDEVQSDLEAQGYEVLPFLLPACAVNAPHRRDRIWFVAHSHSNTGGASNGDFNEERQHLQRRTSRFGIQRTTTNSDNSRTDNISGINGNGTQENERRTKQSFPELGSISSDATNPNSDGLNTSNSEYEINTSERRFNALNDSQSISMHTNSSSESREYIGCERERQFDRSNCRNGINHWQNFPTQPPICGGDDGIPRNMDGITFPKYRQESIKAYGNAIVPQVAHQIFKAIEEMESK